MKTEEDFEKWARWAANKPSRPLALTSIKAYRSSLNALAAWAMERNLDVVRLSQGDLESFLVSRQTKSDGTQANNFTAIQSFYEFLCDSTRKDLDRRDNPANGLTFRRQPPLRPASKRRRPLGSQLAKLPPRDREIANFVKELRDKDLSLFEIFGIKVDPRVVPNRVTVRDGRRVERSVDLSDEARRSLKKWGGEIPIGLRAFQRALEKVDLSPKLLEESIRSVVEVELNPRLQEHVTDEIDNGEFSDAIVNTYMELRKRLLHLNGQPADADVDPFLSNEGALRPFFGDPEADNHLRLLIRSANALFGKPGVRDELAASEGSIAKEIVLLGDMLLRILEDESLQTDLGKRP